MGNMRLQSMETGKKNNNFTTEAEDRMIDEAFREVLNGYLQSNHRKKA